MRCWAMRLGCSTTVEYIAIRCIQVTAREWLAYTAEYNTLC